MVCGVVCLCAIDFVGFTLFVALAWSGCFGVVLPWVFGCLGAALLLVCLELVV